MSLADVHPAYQPVTKQANGAHKLTKPGPGRHKGVPNKNTILLKDALIAAATKAGGKAGLVGYLTKQALENPQSFLPLLGKVLPMQLAVGGDGSGGALVVSWVTSPTNDQGHEIDGVVVQSTTPSETLALEAPSPIDEALVVTDVGEPAALLPVDAPLEP